MIDFDKDAELAKDQKFSEDPQNFLSQDEWLDVDIDDNWLDVTKEFVKPRCLFRINGIECFPIGGLQGITGQAGSGKTQTMSMLIAAALGDTSHSIEYCLTDKNECIVEERKVLYADTEMEEGNTQLVNRRVCAMLNWDFQTPHDEIKYLRLRDEISAVDRWKKILKAIYIMGKELRLVIIDGLIDVISDFNDNKECQEVIFKTMAVAEHYEIALCVVLHQNPGTEKMVGHAGSFLERKATDVFQTKKEKDEFTGAITFVISQIKARGEDVPDLKFRIDNTIHKFGVATLIEKTETEMLQEKEEENLDELMRKYVPRPGCISQTELQKLLKNGERIGSTKAYNLIIKAKSMKIIEAEPVKGRLLYIGKKEIQKTEELPFEAPDNNQKEEF